LEILEAMAAGFSNREIAERLFVSENTVKTHAGRLFDKLSARRRTQAVQRAKEAGIIPCKGDSPDSAAKSFVRVTREREWSGQTEVRPLALSIFRGFDQ